MRFVFGLRTTISAELNSTIATLKMTRCGTHMKLTLIAGRHILNLRHRDKVATNSQKQRHWKKKNDSAPRWGTISDKDSTDRPVQVELRLTREEVATAEN